VIGIVDKTGSEPGVLHRWGRDTNGGPAPTPRKSLCKHADLRLALRDTLDDLSRDPRQPQLKLHPLPGDLAGVQAVTFTCSYRLTMLVRVTGREIVLLDIGAHDGAYP